MFRVNAFNFALVVALFSLSTVHADEQSDDSMQRMLQGRWEIVGGFNQGRELSKQEVDGTYVTITTNSIVTYDRDNQALYQAVFDLDEEKKPVEITMRTVLKNAPTKPSGDEDTEAPAMTALGILKMESDSKWTLCYALPGADRPTKFESPEGSQVMLFSMEKKQGDPIPKLPRKQQ